MGFYFYGKYIYNDGDEKEVESDMSAALPYFRDFYDQDGYEKWENHLEHFFRYFSLTPTQKCHYDQMKLVGEAYWWWEHNHIDYRDWLILQELHAWYAPHLEGSQFSDLVAECKEIIAGMVKMLESKAIKVVDNPESEPEIDDDLEPKPEVYDKSEPKPEVFAESVSQQEEVSPQPMKVEGLPVETLVDLLAEPTLKLVPPLAVMCVSFFLRSPEVYDPLQICLQESGSQVIKVLMVQSAICSVFILDDVPQYAIGVLIKLLSFIAPTRRPVSPPPPWSRCDALVSLSRPLPWPD